MWARRSAGPRRALAMPAPQRGDAAGQGRSTRVGSPDMNGEQGLRWWRAGMRSRAGYCRSSTHHCPADILGPVHHKDDALVLSAGIPGDHHDPRRRRCRRLLRGAHLDSYMASALSEARISHVRLCYERFLGQIRGALHSAWAWEDTRVAYLLGPAAAMRGAL